MLADRAGEDQPERVGAGVLLGAGGLGTGLERVGERVADRGGAGVDGPPLLAVLRGSTYRCPATSMTLRSTAITRAATSTWPMVKVASSPRRSPV